MKRGEKIGDDNVLHISIVGTVGVPAKYGGFETLAENIIEMGNDSSMIDFSVYCSSRCYGVQDRRKVYKGARLYYVPLNANGVQSILYDSLSIVHGVFIRKSDIVLLLGVSGGWVIPLVKLIGKKTKVIVNIDGLEWKRAKWGFVSRGVLKLLEYISVKTSDLIISDNKEIHNYVFREYGIDSMIIAYGGDHALCHNENRSNTDNGGYALSVCRIEPENNIHILLGAFSKIGFPLKVVGNWKNSRYGIELREKFSRFENIEMIDPIYDNEVLCDLRRGCDFYIHGHSAGGTNPSLVEIMHFGKHVIAFDCPYNRFTTKNKASYFNSVDSLVRSIQEYLGGASTNNGNIMKKIAEEEYTWSKIRKAYLAAFARVARAYHIS